MCPHATHAMFRIYVVASYVVLVRGTEATIPATIPAGEHVVVVGDSTLRYLYLSWLYALRRGKFVDYNAAYCDKVKKSLKYSTTGEPGCLWNEMTWGTWSEFFNSTSSIVDDWCDCQRAEYAPLEKIVENRYGTLLPNGARLTYLQYFVMNMHGYWWPGEPNELRTIHTEFSPLWSMPLEDVFRKLLGILRPTIIVLNAGLHLGHTIKDDELQAYATLAKEVQCPIVWATTLGVDVRKDPGNRHMRNTADEARRARKHFAYVFDTYRNWEPVDFYDPRMHHLTGTNILHLLIDLQTYLGLMFGRWNVTRH